MMSGGDHEPGHYYVGIDVGTGSVRAALVDQRGVLWAFAEQPIKKWEPQFNHHEQSSEDIWTACCLVTKEVVQGIDVHRIRGLGFDATCSLVVLDKQFHPLPVNHEGDSSRNVIMWLDHRAVNQVHRINETKHRVLQYVGGVMSVEMQAPKLLWLKENLREICWDKAGHFFDLPDFLSWKATGVTARSLCSLVCKWTYSAEKGWDDSFWKMIGLEDLTDDNYSKIGNLVLPPGASLGMGLIPEAARELGLPSGIAVAASLIDAHAGGLGVIGADVKGHGLICEGQPVTSRLAVICGTSSCHMGISKDPVFVPGVWGPYFSAMVPGFWLNEGGQSVTGKLIDHVVQGHPAFPELQAKATARCQSIYAYLNSHLDLIKKAQPVGFLTVDLHVWPDFHGNRSPLADLTLKGMVTGLTLSQDLDDLAILYLATVQAIAFGTRFIIETMEAAGHSLSTLFLCGGLSKNPLFVQMHADITGMPVVLSQEVESVLVGAAILGACASGDFTSVQEAMARMSKVGKVVFPEHADKTREQSLIRDVVRTLQSLPSSVELDSSTPSKRVRTEFLKLLCSYCCYPFGMVMPKQPWSHSQPRVVLTGLTSRVRWRRQVSKVTTRHRGRGQVQGDIGLVLQFTLDKPLDKLNTWIRLSAKVIDNVEITKGIKVLILIPGQAVVFTCG